MDISNLGIKYLPLLLKNESFNYFILMPKINSALANFQNVSMVLADRYIFAFSTVVSPQIFFSATSTCKMESLQTKVGRSTANYLFIRKYLR